MAGPPIPRGGGWLNGPCAVLCPDGIHGSFQLLQPLPPLLLPAVPQFQLADRLLRWQQVDGGDGEGTDRMLHVPAALRQLHGGPGNFPCKTKFLLLSENLQVF